MSSSSNSHPAISPLLTETHRLETDRGSDLEGIPLIRRAVREFLEVFEAQARISHREHSADGKSQRVYAVALLRLSQINPRPRPGAGLTLLVTDQSGLEGRCSRAAKRSH